MLTKLRSTGILFLITRKGIRLHYLQDVCDLKKSGDHPLFFSGINDISLMVRVKLTLIIVINDGIMMATITSRGEEGKDVSSLVNFLRLPGK